jgi:hypothetical protein
LQDAKTRIVAGVPVIAAITGVRLTGAVVRLIRYAVVVDFHYLNERTKCMASCFEWMISYSQMKRGGSPTSCSIGSGTAQSTSLGMMSGCVAQATTIKRLKSSPLVEAGAGSKTRQAEPITAWTKSGDHMWAGMLLTTSSTLKRSGLKSALDYQRQRRKRRLNAAPAGGGTWSTWSADAAQLKTSRKSSGLERRTRTSCDGTWKNSSRYAMTCLVETVGRGLATIATSVVASLASAASTAAVWGITLVSNLGRRLATPSGGEEGGGDGRMWRGDDPLGVGSVSQLEGVLSLDEPEETPRSTDDCRGACAHRGRELDAPKATSPRGLSTMTASSEERCSLREGLTTSGEWGLL